MAKKGPPPAATNPALTKPVTLDHFFQWAQALNEREGMIVSTLQDLKQTVTELANQVAASVHTIADLKQQNAQLLADSATIDELEGQLNNMEQALSEANGPTAGGSSATSAPDQVGEVHPPPPPPEALQPPPPPPATRALQPPGPRLSPAETAAKILGKGKGTT
jgi:hypothetical protein